ncbi:synaptotagmin-3 [Rhododendron vialii]|uniref:synaptotagmin-3 n=1 Tax=Rhododendron vialii TaxID=182163 RepID=UPI00265EB5DF|nr:synaptotagmin-3 [Rhododendron vialii]
MGFLSTFLGILGFGIGLPFGILVGFYFFVYSKPKDVENPIVRPLHEMDTTTLQEILHEIPLWVKSPDYDRVDWLNQFLLDMWPYLDKAICKTIRIMARPIFAEYIGKYQIESIDFGNLSLGTLPPIIQGMKAYDTEERELVMEPAMKWAGNPNITLMLKILSLSITVQLVDLQVFVAPRITLKHLVPTFPCFSSMVVSLMGKPHVDFGLKVLGGDIMSIPGLYRFVQEAIKKQVSILYHWPQTLEIPILDASTVAVRKPVGILHVKVIRAIRLLKMDLIGTSDPYVKLSLSEERLPAKKTTVKKRNLNPEWNENFRLIVKNPQTQVLNINVYDWDKVGAHDRLGSQVVPLKLLTPHEPKEFTLDLLKSTFTSDSHHKKPRGQIVVELTYDHFKEDSDDSSEHLKRDGKKENRIDRASGNESPSEAGLLLVTVYGADDVEGGGAHNNPYVFILFRREKKKSKMIRKTHHPMWNEDFQFMLEEPPLNDKIHIEVMSKRTRFSFRSKESLGFVEINLADVVHNGHINQKYHLIGSKNGVVHVELGWKKT